MIFLDRLCNSGLGVVGGFLHEVFAGECDRREDVLNTLGPNREVSCNSPTVPTLTMSYEKTLLYGIA